MKYPIFQTIIAAAGTFFTYLYGEGTPLLGVLLTFVVLDYLTGVLAAGNRGQLSSAVGFKGIRAKVFIFILVAVAHQVDKTLGEPGLVMAGTIYFYLANEALSIVENAGQAGLPVPEVITRAVAVLKGKSEVKKE